MAEKLENDPDEVFSQIEEVISTMSKDQKVEASVEFEKVFKVKNYMQEKGNLENLKIALGIVTKLSVSN